MTSLTTYRATDRRVYQGALCSDMERQVQHTENLLKRLRQTSPTATCTYFPVEGKFMVFHKPDPERTWREVTSNFHECKQSAIIEAIQTLEPPCTDWGTTGI